MKGIDWTEEGSIRIQDGIQAGCLELGGVSLEELKGLREWVASSVKYNDWENVWASQVKLIRMDFIEKMFAIWQKFCTKKSEKIT